MVVTGAEEQLGRHLRDAARAGYDVFGVAPRPRQEYGVPNHPDIRWFEVDLLDRAAVEATFREIGAEGNVDLVVYLALPSTGAGATDDRRRKVNEVGLRNVLETSRWLDPGRIVVASPEDSPAENETESAIDQVLNRYGANLRTSRITFAGRPRLVLLGASGFIGRHLVGALKEDFHVLGLARTSRQACGVPAHADVSWHQVDIGDAEATTAVFRKLREGGGADVVIHLAAYYDFTGDDHAEYRRTNVEGLRNVLEGCRALRPKKFVFASSIAASDFPVSGSVLDESSAADGRHPYAVSKRIGEAMLAEYRDAFPSAVVRLGAVFSDWCEYPPVFVALERWRSRVWNRRILGGRGRFAIPYLHIRDVESFVVKLIGRVDELEPGETLLASTDEPVSLRDLFVRVTWYGFGDSERVMYVPKALCAPAMHLRDLMGRTLGRRPFERPWMARYIDREMRVDATRTRARLGWSPRERFELLRRIPFLVENLRRNPVEWHKRNQAILRRERTAPNLRIHRLLERHEQKIVADMDAVVAGPGQDPALSRHAALATSEQRWTHRAALHELMAAIRTLEMGIYLSFCRDLSERRFANGFVAAEVSAVLRALGDSAVKVLLEDPEAAGLATQLRDRIAMTTLFGCDQVEESFEGLLDEQVRRQRQSSPA